MRLFIAICLDEKIKKDLSFLQKNIRIDSLNPKWVKPEHCHITLKFLGEVEKDRLSEIFKVCREIPKPKPFIISFGTLGAFPKLDYPRVIWIGLEKGNDLVLSLVNSLEHSLFAIGFPKEERTFEAHLTLARIKSPQKTDLLFPYLSQRPIPYEMEVKEIALIESTLTPKGPIYTIIQTFPL